MPLEQPLLLDKLRVSGASETDNRNVRDVFRCIGDGVAEIVRSGAIGASDAATALESENRFGDVQLQADVAAEGAIRKALSECSHVGIVSSEETPTSVVLRDGGEYGVAFDPLDGSSIIKSNFSVGSIFGIFRLKDGGAKRTFAGLGGADMVGAAYAVFGPRTVLVVGYEADAPGVVEEYVLTSRGWEFQAKLSLGDSKKLMAPANLRASAENEAYRLLVSKWMTDGYTLRYTGGMVPDIHNLMCKGGRCLPRPTTCARTPRLPDSLTHALVPCQVASSATRCLRVPRQSSAFSTNACRSPTWPSARGEEQLQRETSG